MSECTNIMRLVGLIRALEQDARSADSKVRIIKMYRDNGVITNDEAVDLVIEYCY